MIETIVICFCIILALFIIWRVIEHEGNTYRFEKYTFADNHEQYYIKRKTRLFWIGPYIWEYYSSEDNHIVSFCLLKCLSTEFGTLDEAKKKCDAYINREIARKSHAKIINKEEINR